jgi:hypothetical protein
MVMKSVLIGQNWEETWMVFTIWTPAEARNCFFWKFVGQKNPIIGVKLIFEID